MNARSDGHWTTTTLTAFVLLGGGAAYLSRAGFAVPGVVALGYPTYFVTTGNTGMLRTVTSN